MTMPWDGRAVVRLYLASFLGASLIALGWYGASGSGELRSQVAWVDIAAIGLVVTGTGEVVWLLQGHRAVRARERGVLERSAGLIADASATLDDGTLVAVPGARRAHRPDCPLVRRKQTTAVDPGLLASCEACLR